MLTINRPARTPATHGIAQWLPDAANGNRVLAINGTAYEVEDVAGGLALYRIDPEGRVIRYTMDRTWPGAWQCSCPDATYRRRECKHCLAVRAALAAEPF